MLTRSGERTIAITTFSVEPSMSAAPTEIVVLSDSDDELHVCSPSRQHSTLRVGSQHRTETASAEVGGKATTQNACRLLAALDHHADGQSPSSSTSSISRSVVKPAKRKIRENEASSRDPDVDKAASKEQERQEKLLQKQAVKVSNCVGVAD